MRTHASIIADADEGKIAHARMVSIHTVRSWRQRNSIPAEHWGGMVELGFASLEELAATKAPRRRAAREGLAA